MYQHTILYPCLSDHPLPYPSTVLALQRWLPCSRSRNFGTRGYVSIDNPTQNLVAQALPNSRWKVRRSSKHAEHRPSSIAPHQIVAFDQPIPLNAMFIDHGSTSLAPPPLALRLSYTRVQYFQIVYLPIFPSAIP